MARTPTDNEYANYDGMHCRLIWHQLDDSWRCPVCERNKRKILQWGKRTGINATVYGAEGWRAGIHKHHDHGSDIFTPSTARFAAQYICGACNFLDVRLKKAIGIKSDCSFSPVELKQCLINAEANQPIKRKDIDFNMAETIAKVNGWMK